MQHFPFWLALAAGLGTACLLGSVSAAAEDFPAVPVATATTQGTWETRGDGSRCYYDADGTPVTGEVTIDGTAYLFDYTGTQKTGLFFGGIVEKNNADFVDNTAKIRYNVGEQK